MEKTNQNKSARLTKHSISLPQYRKPPYLFRKMSMYMYLCICIYGVATISRLLQGLGLLYKRALPKRLHSAKEAYDFKEPTNRSHPIPLNQKLANSPLATQFTTHIDVYMYKDTTTCRYTDIFIYIYITRSLESACDSIYHTYRHTYLDRGSSAIVQHSSVYKLSNIHECEYIWPLISYDRTLKIRRHISKSKSEISGHIYSNSYILFNFHTNECFTITELPWSMYEDMSWDRLYMYLIYKLWGISSWLNI